MNIDYNNPTTVKIIKQFKGKTEDNREFLIQAIWTKDSWTIDMILWFNNDGDKLSELNIKSEFLYEIANSN
jgi:hypothetical protein